MVDKLTVEKRSALMSKIRGKDTKPELLVRSLIHRAGYRFRKHRADLPGTPDLVFPSRKKVIFVHGCFWHGHNCKIGHIPKSRSDFWLAKITRNKNRDQRNLVLLGDLGWQSLTIAIKGKH